MSAVELDDVAYEVVVSGVGPLVLFVHGFTGSGADWAPAGSSMAASHTAILVDLLGHGGSAHATEAARYLLERQAADLARIVERLEQGPATVVAYSYGARIALQLALDHPSVVSGLALESPSAGIADATERAARREADEALARDIERDGIDAFVERWEALPLFDGERRLPSPVRADLARRRRANDPASLAAALRGAGQGTMAPLHARLSTIAVPVAILAGALDPSGLARARTVAEGVPAATLEILDDVGHAPHREAPDRFAAWLARALDRIAAPSSVLVPTQRRSAP